MKRVKAA